MLQQKRYALPMPPRRPPAQRAATFVPFDCRRCLLHVDFETDGTTHPEGWTTVIPAGKADLVWRCASCVREVSAGSPEEL